MTEYRNEHKFICQQLQIEVLKARLGPVLRPDAHQAGESYRVRSLYFDDEDDSAFYDNDAGTDNRKKFRIRVYDHPEETIRLEIKYKKRGGTHKESCPLPRELCEDILAGRGLKWRADYAFPLQEFYRQIGLNGLRPRVIVEYERSAYVCRAGNVRITFDRNIACSERIGMFLQDAISLFPILPPNVHLLEVKYDEFIPDHILQLLETGELTRTTFSKYYLACLAQKGEYIW